MPKVIQVIESAILVGDGTDSSPMRHVTTYHSLDGHLLAYRDALVPYDGRFGGHIEDEAADE